jgi:hypothetical protein
LVAVEQSTRVGRVLRASTRGFACGTQSNRIDNRHDFGAFVNAPIANDDSIHVVGLIYAVEIKDDLLVNELVMAETLDGNILRDQRENRMVPMEISVLNIGYRYEMTGMVIHSLPPRPPMSLSEVELCSAENVFRFTQRTDFFPLVLNASEVPSDDLLAATIRYASWAYPESQRYEFLVRCGRELARQLSHDLKRLEHVLALIRPQ